MALDWVLKKLAIQDTLTSFTIADQTVYGTGGNPARVARANVLFVTKTAANGDRTLLSNTPNSATPTVVSEWDVTSDADGWYEKLLASVTVHTPGQSYASADLILYHSGVFYITKSAVPISTDPPNATYFDVITAASLYTTYLDNESIEWVMQDELVTPNIEEKINEAYEHDADNFLANKCAPESFTEADFLNGMLNAAQAALDNGRPEDAEEIVRGIDAYYLNAA